MALFTACHFGMMLLYHVLLALGCTLFHQIQILCDQANEFAIEFSSLALTVPHLQPSSRQGVRSLPIDQVNNLQVCLTVG